MRKSETTPADRPRYMRLALIALVLFWVLLFIATHVPLLLPVTKGRGADKIAHSWAISRVVGLEFVALRSKPNVDYHYQSVGDLCSASVAGSSVQAGFLDANWQMESEFPWQAIASHGYLVPTASWNGDFVF